MSNAYATLFLRCAVPPLLVVFVRLQRGYCILSAPARRAGRGASVNLSSVYRWPVLVLSSEPG
jgi:hypothetical protein